MNMPFNAENVSPAFRYCVTLLRPASTT